jgi:hypothetical protein
MMLQSFLCDAFYPSFWADLLIAFLGALLSLAAAYLIYWLSITQVRKDRLKYVAALIEKIAPSAIQQADYCSKYAALITEQPFTTDQLQLEANRDPKRLADKVDQEGIYHAYLWKYKRTNETYKGFQQLYANIDFLDFLIDDLIKTNERVLTFTWERKKQYQLTFRSAMQAIQSLSLTPDLVQNQQALVTHAGGLLEHFVQNQPAGENIVQSYQGVVEPLQEYIVAHGQQHSKLTELLFLLHDLTNQYHGIEISGAHNASDYNDYATKLKETAQKLIENSKQFRNDFSTIQPHKKQ